MAVGDKHCTAGLSYDTVAKPGILFTAGSYTEPVATTFIIAVIRLGEGPTCHKPAVILTTFGCLNTVRQSRGGD
jgi:hypothetical protein